MDWQDDGYRAIGRWFVEFARLVGGMRANMEERLREPDHPEVAQLIFGAATAKQISDAFFAMCRLIGDFDEAETNVANQLQKAADEEITRRNNIAHGDWIIGKGNDPQPRKPLSSEFIPTGANLPTTRSRDTRRPTSMS